MVKIKNILVPVDGSKTSLKGFDLALILAKLTDAKITALHVIRISHDFNFPVSSEIKVKHSQSAEKIIEQVKKKADKEKIKLMGKIISGENIGKEILNFSRNKKIDFIIIGSKGPDPGTESFFGSVANYVVHKSKIPTTIVK